MTDPRVEWAQGTYWRLLDTEQADAPTPGDAENLIHSPRCDECGRFAKSLRDVWVTGSTPEIDHEACERCRPDLFKRGGRQ